MALNSGKQQETSKAFWRTCLCGCLLTDCSNYENKIFICSQRCLFKSYYFFLLRKGVFWLLWDFSHWVELAMVRIHDVLFPEAPDTDIFPLMHCVSFLFMYFGLQELDLEVLARNWIKCMFGMYSGQAYFSPSLWGWVFHISPELIPKSQHN